MIKKYSACSVSVSKITPRALLTLVIGMGLVLVSLVVPDLVWWSKLLIGIMGFLMSAEGYYQLKYTKGLGENGFVVNTDDKTMTYYNEFEGNKTISLEDFSELKIYKRSRAIYLLELKYKNSKKQENINTNALYTEDIDEIIGYIKTFNNHIKVSKNN